MNKFFVFGNSKVSLWFFVVVAIAGVVVAVFVIVVFVVVVAVVIVVEIVIAAADSAAADSDAKAVVVFVAVIVEIIMVMVVEVAFVIVAIVGVVIDFGKIVVFHNLPGNYSNNWSVRHHDNQQHGNPVDSWQNTKTVSISSLSFSCDNC